ncbi:helix-turn-helix domain-containing protein [Streptomyces sp. HPF1205]|uniref:helix-turn-helix domain-containing protein n=1 Tax=Streptomyces sp. HPF1205 TaxID=2873262 RepID=UPI001CEC56AF|nr:helix-turn-helix domain-containing protein [Streptomyces sp. HPF1205]
MAEEEDGEEAARRVFEALDAVETMADPIAQARVIGRLLKDQAERNKRFYEKRREVVLALRAQKVSYRKIAAELGVSLGTVQDIERGAGRWAARPGKGSGGAQ